MLEYLKDEKSIIIDILVDAFENNKSVNFIVKQDENKRKRIRNLMNYAYELCLKYGEVHLSENRKACALILHTEKRIPLTKKILNTIKLIINCIGINNIYKTLTREIALENHKIPANSSHLWFLGVCPNFQGRGEGSILMQKIIQKSKIQKRNIYLETSMTQNINFYKKLGFELYTEIEYPYHLYFFKYEFIEAKTD